MKEGDAALIPKNMRVKKNIYIMSFSDLVTGNVISLLNTLDDTRHI